MVLLTQKQRDDLNAAILEYLVNNKLSKTAQQFIDESTSSLTLPNTEAVSSIKKDLLEKKWTSVVRLKKQVMELEK